MDKRSFIEGLMKKRVLWSYSPDADLPDGIIVEYTLKYGEVHDIINLFEIFSEDFISQTWLETMSNDDRFDKTNHYLKLFFLKNLDDHEPVETRYEKIKRISEGN
jgi:hypothetical protein